MKRPPSSKLHLLYFVLAAFDILTVSGSLYLNHTIMQIYKDSVEVNLGWAQRNSQYSELADLAQQVNAPGNDVFDTLDVEGAKAKRLIALKRFNQSFEKAKKKLIDH